MSLKEQDIVLTTVDVDGNKIIQLPVTRVENVEGALKTVNDVHPDNNGNLNLVTIPIGTIYAYAGTDVPEGTLRLNGQVINNCDKAYPEFFEWVKTKASTIALSSYTLVEGQCGRFGLDGTTVRLPTLTSFVKAAPDGAVVGTVEKAGIPNITGGLTHWDGTITPYGGGAFYDNTSAGSSKNGAKGQHSHAGYVAFDASRCSAVYGKSNTVTPTNVAYPYLIQVYNGTPFAGTNGGQDFTTLLDNYLPKTGGHVSGNLYVQNKHVLRSVNGLTAGADGNVKVDFPVTSVNGEIGDVNLTGQSHITNLDSEITFRGGACDNLKGFIVVSGYKNTDAVRTMTDVYTIFINGVSVGTVDVVFQYGRWGGAGYGRTFDVTPIGYFEIVAELKDGDTISFARTTSGISFDTFRGAIMTICATQGGNS